MLFGSSLPWGTALANMARKQQPAPQPTPLPPAPQVQPYPTQQMPQAQQAGQAPINTGQDLMFANNLAQQYASQLQNQTVAGGYYPPPPQPQYAAPVAQTPLPPQGGQPISPQQHQAPDQYHAMIQAWRAQRPQHTPGMTDWRSQIGAWQALRPQKAPHLG